MGIYCTYNFKSFLDKWELLNWSSILTWGNNKESANLGENSLNNFGTSFKSDHHF